MCVTDAMTMPENFTTIFINIDQRNPRVVQWPSLHLAPSVGFLVDRAYQALTAGSGVLCAPRVHLALYHEQLINLVGSPTKD